MRATFFATLRPAAMVWSLVLTVAPGQGPLYREHWGYLHLERRREQLCNELRQTSGTDATATLDALAADFAGGGADRPFAREGRALARLRGVDCDAAFELRHLISAYVLPEVVDPESDRERCRDLHPSVFLPCSLPAPGVLSFELEVFDADGASLGVTEITRETEVFDLRMARASVPVSCADLADGVYRIVLRTLIDGERPRAADPVLEWTFHVLRGYQRRAEQALQTAAGLREQLDALPQALLDGFALEVSRAYGGEAFAGEPDGVVQLERLERALANLAAGSSPLAGMSGDLRTALPAGDGPRPCLLRIAAPAERAVDAPRVTSAGDGAAGADGGEERGVRRLVVFATGAPSYDGVDSRPLSPACSEATWLARELDAPFDGRGIGVVVLDSPGGGRDYAAGLVSALEALKTLFPAAPRPVLVCDREAATVAALHIVRIAPHVAGMVLVGGGVLTPASLAAIGPLPLRYVRLAGARGGDPADLMLARAAKVRERDGGNLDIALLHERVLPWPFGVALSQSELAAFVDATGR